MQSEPVIQIRNLTKIYRDFWGRKKVRALNSLSLDVNKGEVFGLLGPNGSGKTTLFELITGSNQPTAGEVMCMGKNIHDVRYRERDRLAIHYHQSYQVRHFAKRKPAFMMQPAGSDYPMVHLFDEPQFNTQDGYIGFMLEFFQKLRSEGRLVFLCVHPNERFHLEILQEICEQFIFVRHGQLSHAPDFETLVTEEPVREYLGELLH